MVAPPQIENSNNITLRKSYTTSFKQNTSTKVAKSGTVKTQVQTAIKAITQNVDGHNSTTTTKKKSTNLFLNKTAKSKKDVTNRKAVD